MLKAIGRCFYAAFQAFKTRLEGEWLDFRLKKKYPNQPRYYL